MKYLHVLHSFLVLTVISDPSKIHLFLLSRKGTYLLALLLDEPGDTSPAYRAELNRYKLP